MLSFECSARTRDSGQAQFAVGPFPLLPNLTQYFLDCPDVIRDARFHRGSDAEGGVNPAEVISAWCRGQLHRRGSRLSLRSHSSVG
jgi:hypothetical protein